jgi:NADPH2:quinone reductase
VTEEIPKPADGEVLVKVAYSTFNPVDRYQYYLFKTERVGSDGSGTIVALGNGVDPTLLNKKVAFIMAAWS